MADFELHGYLTTGKFQVNDYEIEIERVEGGMRMRVRDGMGKVQEAIVKDGASEISNDDAMTIREMFDALSNAFPEWQKNEQDRKNAERDRAAAESTRLNTFKQMQEALAKFDIDAINSRLDAVTATANGAANTAGTAEITANNAYNTASGVASTAQNALNTAQGAATTANGAATAAGNASDAARAANESAQSALSLIEDMFYHSGDTITIGDAGTAQSTSFNASGYVISDRKEIDLKFPVAKRLDRISTVACNSFVVHIVNSGGYGLGSSYQDGGYDFTGTVTECYADKVQGCIHLKLRRESGFTLAANECVSARIGRNRNSIPAVMFTLM